MELAVVFHTLVDQTRCIFQPRFEDIGVPWKLLDVRQFRLNLEDLLLPKVDDSLMEISLALILDHVVLLARFHEASHNEDFQGLNGGA